MKRIKIAIVDFAPKEGYLAERLLSFVNGEYEFEVTENNPDYILHSCMGNRALLFDGVRIFYTAENFTPDFNISDYAIGMDRLVFGDRYFRLPLYRLYFDTYSKLFEDRTLGVEGKSCFCTCVVSNSRRDPLFDELFKLLNNYEQVQSGGRLFNNVGGRVADKIEFMRTGRFGMAFENSAALGYITEKITDVYAAAAVPIYYGDPTVVQDFNPDSFINIASYGTLEDAVADIVSIDQDEQRYLNMLKAPVFKDGAEPEYLSDRAISSFLKSIFDQPLEDAFRRNRMIRGQIYAKKLKTAYFRPHVQATRLFRDWMRKKRGKKVFVPPPSI